MAEIPTHTETPRIQALSKSLGEFLAVPRGGFNEETKDQHMHTEEEFALTLVDVIREGTREEAAQAVVILLIAVRALAHDQGMTAVNPVNGSYAR